MTGGKSEKNLIFIAKAEAAHGGKYDYSKADYKSSHIKVCITCPLHGDFWQTPNCHIRNSGCSSCGVLRRSQERREHAAQVFEQKARKVHGKHYDYSMALYTKASAKLVIVCPEHGPFLQRASNHLRGVGCPGCKSEKLRVIFSKSHAKFFIDARRIHGQKYRYGHDYSNSHTPMTITCPNHGDFKQTPATHLRGSGCPICAQLQRIEKSTKKHDAFVEQAKEAHPGKAYHYSDPYCGWNIKIAIECRRHGVFRQTPNNHLRHGCPKCQAEESSARQRIGHSAFVAKARKVHGTKYKYPEPYQTALIPIEVVCRKHGSFRQIPNVHLSGSGCPSCSESKGEIKIESVLKKMQIRFVRQKTFQTCRDKHPLRFDFFCCDHNLLIEFDGPQHFQTIEHWGGDDALVATIRRDQMKKSWANKNRFRLLRIPYTQFDEIEELVTSEIRSHPRPPRPHIVELSLGEDEE